MVGNWTHGLVSGVNALWEAGVAGKALAVATGWQVMTLDSHIRDPQNFAVNIATVVVVYVVARRLAKTKIKDGTIKDLNDSVEAKGRRVAELVETVQQEQQQKRQIEQAAQHLKEQVVAAEARYEEQSKYTAGPAVEHFEAVMAEHSAKVAERHAMMLDALERMTVTQGQMTATLALIERGMNGRGSTST